MVTERTCQRDDCDRPHHAKGYCRRHYGHATGRHRPAAVYPDTCNLFGCDEPHYGKGMCEQHYKQARYRQRKRERAKRPPYSPIYNFGPCMADDCEDEPMGQGAYCLEHFYSEIVAKNNEAYRGLRRMAS